MNYEDEVEEGAEAVRSFMVTRGRVRAKSNEFSIETMVSATSHARTNARDLRFEQQEIVTRFTEPVAIAEIAARLNLPVRAVQVLASDMIADGHLQQHGTVSNKDSSMLLRLRSAVAAL